MIYDSHCVFEHNTFHTIMQHFSETFKEIYRAKALERVSANNPKKEVPQIIMVWVNLSFFVHAMEFLLT